MHCWVCVDDVDVDGGATRLDGTPRRRAELVHVWDDDRVGWAKGSGSGLGFGLGLGLGLLTVAVELDARFDKRIDLWSGDLLRGPCRRLSPLVPEHHVSHTRHAGCKVDVSFVTRARSVRDRPPCGKTPYYCGDECAHEGAYIPARREYVDEEEQRKRRMRAVQAQRRTIRRATLPLEKNTREKRLK